MTESELIARWLGWIVIPGKLEMLLPDFRTSNEWAGAVLEKLSQYYPTLHCTDYVNDKWRVQLNSKYHEVTVYAVSWRSAVVDAALEVIRCEASATSEQL